MEQLVKSGLFDRYMKEFYGYGNFNSKYWFIGLEEAGTSTIKEIGTRINTWYNMGGGELLDVREFHLKAGEYCKEVLHDAAAYANLVKCFENGNGNSPKLQPTWNGLIRILLSAEGEKKVNTEQIRDFQISKLGRAHSNHCLIEVYPIACLSERSFPLNNLEYIKEFNDKVGYKKYIYATRIDYIKKQIERYKPKAVVIYKKDKKVFADLAGLNANEVKETLTERKYKNSFRKVYQYKKEDTFYINIPHTSNIRDDSPFELLEYYGKYIAQNI